MTGDTIKSFLVGLGFGVDEASLKAFNHAIASATLKVTALYASTKIAATGIAFGISKISESFEQLGYEYKIIAPAINRTILLRKEMLKAYSAAGVNLVKVIQDSVRLNFSLTKTKYAFEAIYKSVASRFFGLLTKQSDIFRKKLYDNMPKIQAALETFVSFIFRAFEATTILGARIWSILSRVYDFFVQLDHATDGWSTKILGALAAWKLFNLGFLATPLGAILALSLALLSLYDDFMVWKEGGQAFFDWGSETTKVMVGLGAAIGSVAVALGAVIVAMKAYAAVQAIVNGVMFLNPIGLLLAGLTALVALLTLADQKWRIFGGNLSGFFGGLGGRILDFVGGSNVAANLGAGGIPAGAPLLGGGTHNQSNVNQNVQQQSTFHISETADAQATGQAVNGILGGLNFSLVRDLQGATRPAALNGNGPLR